MTEILFKHAANLITISRIILTFFLNGLIWFNSEVNFSLIFFLAVIVGITDWLDGYIARKWEIVSPLGGDLDKFADKLYACSLFAYFIKREIINWDFGHVLFIFVGSLIVLILCIEFVLIVIWIVGFFKEFETKSNKYGKIKMAIQFVAIGYWFLIEWIGSLVGYKLHTGFYFTLIPLFIAASFFGILSIIGYYQRYYPNSEENKEGEEV